MVLNNLSNFISFIFMLIDRSILYPVNKNVGARKNQGKRGLDNIITVKAIPPKVQSASLTTGL